MSHKLFRKKCSWPGCSSETVCATESKMRTNYIKHLDWHIGYVTYYIETYKAAMNDGSRETAPVLVGV